MEVTRALGYRFLWVDALCIVQDSPDDLGIQLAQMDRIYRLAAVTIVARASKSSDSGLPDVSIPRNWPSGENLTLMTNCGLHVSCWDTLHSDYENYEEEHGKLVDRECYMWRGWTSIIQTHDCIGHSFFVIQLVDTGSEFNLQDELMINKVIDSLIQNRMRRKLEDSLLLCD